MGGSGGSEDEGEEKTAWEERIVLGVLEGDGSGG